MRQIADFYLDMIPNSGNTIFHEDEVLLADNVGTHHIFMQDPTHSRLPMKTNFIMVLFCFRGGMDACINQQKIHLNGDDIVIVKNNDIVYSASFDAGFEAFVIGISNIDYFDLYNTNILQIRNYSILNNHFTVSHNEMEHYFALYNMMRGKLLDDGFLLKKEFVSKCMSLMSVIFHDNLMKAMQENRPVQNQRNIIIFDKFIHLVKRHFRQQHSQQFYANELCLSAKYMSQVIHQVSGHFASEWIIQYLVDEAKTLLLDGHYTSMQIADKLGFPSASYFLRFFKRETGMTPMQYQRF